MNNENPEPLKLSYMERLALNNYKKTLQSKGLKGLFFYIDDADELQFDACTEPSQLITTAELESLREQIINLLDE